MKNKKGILKFGLHVAVLLGLIIAAVKYINGEEFLNALEKFNWMIAPLVVLLGVASMVVKGWRFASMLKDLEEIKRGRAIQAYVAGQSATLLPGGIAARAALLDQVGIPAEKSSAVIAVSSFSDQAMFLALSMFCAAWFESARKPVLILIAVLAGISILLGIEASRTWLFNVIEKILGKFKLAESRRKFLDSLQDTLKWRVILQALLNTALAFALLIGALYLSLRGMGVSVPVLTLILAFTLPTMLGRISALPGGVGVTEFGMTGILNAAPDVSLDQAAAAVAIFRVGTVFFSALVGGLVYLFSWRRTVDKAAKEAAA